MHNQPTVVLLAEDDDLIREIIADFLVEGGSTVIQVADAAQALEVLRESSYRIDLLFTDVRMPGSMDGMELAKTVAKTWPEIKILIASGHMRPSPKEIPSGSRFLAKPYSWRDLHRAIGTLLANSILGDSSQAANGNAFQIVRTSNGQLAKSSEVET